MNNYLDWKKFVKLVILVWLIQATYATLNTGIFQQYSGGETRWMAISIYNYSTALVWILFTPAILWLILRLDSSSFSTARTIVLYLIVGVAVSSLQRLINSFLTYGLIRWTKAVDPSLLSLDNFFGSNYFRNVGNGILVYGVIVAIIHAYLFYKSNQSYKMEQMRLEGELSRVQLENLSYQLQPHFLFNSLQSVSTLMHRDLDAADRALGDLGDLLRHSIKNIGVEKVRLGEELLHLQKYVDLQQTRYQDQLTIRIDFQKTILDALVPSFMLQPVVENSIKHGIEKIGEAMEVRIEAKVEKEEVIIRCRDNGRKTGEKNAGHLPGLGLSNLGFRLKMLYGERASLQHGPGTPGGYLTTIKIPLEIN